MVRAETDATAQSLFEDMGWFRNQWPVPFGQGLPKLLVGSPDTLWWRIEPTARTLPIEERSLLIPQGDHDRAKSSGRSSHLRRR